MTHINPKAKEWATVCLDPYHDYAVGLEGLPDSQTGRSYVRVHNQAVNLAANADSDNISVHFTGFHTSHENMTWTTSYNYNNGQSNFSAVNVLRSGSAHEPNYVNWLASNATMIAHLPTALDGGVPSRLIGIGLEIHDVTAALYRKGTITSAHLQGTIEHQDVTRYYTDENADLHFVAERQDVTQTDPASLSHLSSYPGVLTLPASKGLYIVGRLNSPRKPVRYEGFSPIPSPHAWGLTSTDGTNNIKLNRALKADDYTVINNIEGATHSGFDGFKIQLSGIPAEGQYRLTLRTIVEYFPDSSDLTALGISTPSPPYCPDVFQYYHDVVTRLPTAVPVGSNAGGDYWRAVVALAKKYAPSLLQIAPLALTAAGQPELAAIASAVGRVIGNQLRVKPVQQKLPAKPRQPRRRSSPRKRS